MNGDAVPDTPPAQWIRLWQILADLDEQARRLRYLSQHEPLAQPTPGYPRAGTHRSHAGEVRKALEDILARFEELRSLVPAALSPTLDLPGIAADEHPHALAQRLEPLLRLASGLREQAFQPAPPLPPHSPPYLVELPGHDLAGTKAVQLAIGIEGLADAVRNVMLAAANARERHERLPDAIPP
ncbi:MAG: hypothetical protein E6H03_10630 [Bacillati bacterium ANGP1]|uniref:Uncharacterized protein n=1 Tax=Candidatus Segetimicrobium genomatis TaxID=2569760 RepID=A0A537J6R3_9BACT|nr:MAG: hypothetical protein E6H03_10630 [Terrabacteria group bacterium ANGP1]